MRKYQISSYATDSSSSGNALDLALCQSQLLYMKPDNFKLHCTLYLWHQNQMKKEQWVIE